MNSLCFSTFSFIVQDWPDNTKLEYKSNFSIHYSKKNSTGAVKTAAAAFKGEVAFSPGEKTPNPHPIQTQ
jgi:hypothetical protein